MSLSQIKIKRVVRELDLEEYQPEYAGTVIKVWVNPPIKLRNEMNGLLIEYQQATMKSLLVADPIRWHKEAGKKLPEDGQGLTKGTQEEIEAANEAAKEARRRYYAFFATFWEGDSAEDVLALAEVLEEQEPALWDFLRRRTLEMIKAYADDRKKA